jgi:hypothetical protein
LDMKRVSDEHEETEVEDQGTDAATYPTRSGGKTETAISQEATSIALLARPAGRTPVKLPVVCVNSRSEYF